MILKKGAVHVAFKDLSSNQKQSIMEDIEKKLHRTKRFKAKSFN